MSKGSIVTWILIGLFLCGCLSFLVFPEGLWGADELAGVISAEQLAKEFDDNEVAANQKYKGKIIRVKGKVEEISMSLVFNKPELELDGDIFRSDISCEFKKVEADKIARLKVGDHVVVRGKCSHHAFSWVYMENCELVEVK